MAALVTLIATQACLVALAVPHVVQAAPFRTWSAVYQGGSGAEEMEGIALTSDGGYVVVGSTDSFGDTVRGDAWVVKLDPYGTVQWQKTYGGLNDESLVDVRQTPDGGYITAGWTKSFGVSKMNGWVVKLSAAGTVEWEKTYGGSGKEQFWSVDRTRDGGYLVAGGTTSFGAGAADYWVLKLDSSGNVQWQKTYGGSKADGGAGSYPEYVVRALEDPDGNFVVASESYSFGSGSSDIWVLKLDPAGNVLWQYAYGGADEDSMWTFDITTDGGYIVPGNTVSFSPDFSGDTWILKLDKNGAIQWQQILGVAGDWDESLTVGATSDGGALIGSYVEQGSSDWDLLLFRLDASGNVDWQRYYEYGWDWPNAIKQTEDGGFAVAGVAWPQPADLKLWMLRLDSGGRIGPSCSVIHDLALVSGTTAAFPVATHATVQDTTVLPQSTSAVVQDSGAAPDFVCQGDTGEDCTNSIDDDRDGLIDCDDPDCRGDSDGDTYIAAPCGPDCDDLDPAVNPSATELCTNGRDDECDGLVDCSDPDCQTGIDADGDAYFSGPCGTDCDDTDASVNPGMAEQCGNIKDDDCDGAADCTDGDCLELPICTLAAQYGRRRSMTKFNLRRSSRDSAVAKVCVTQSFCDALPSIAGDPNKQMSVTLDSCPAILISGERLLSNAAATVFKVKSPSAQTPRYVVRVVCRKLEATVKSRKTELQGCMANPLGVTLAASGTRSLQAEETFDETRDGNGDLRRLSYLSSVSCAP